MARNYKREYAKFQSSKKAIAERSARNKAHRAKGVDGKDVDHKKPLRSGGSKSVSNTRVRSVHANRADNGHRPGEKQRRK